MKDDVFTHKGLWKRVGLTHGTGVICCGCPDCHCFLCYMTKYDERKKPEFEHRDKTF